MKLWKDKIELRGQEYREVLRKKKVTGTKGKQTKNEDLGRTLMKKRWICTGLPSREIEVQRV